MAGGKSIRKSIYVCVGGGGGGGGALSVCLSV